MNQLRGFLLLTELDIVAQNWKNPQNKQHENLEWNLVTVPTYQTRPNTLADSGSFRIDFGRDRRRLHVRKGSRPPIMWPQTGTGKTNQKYHTKGLSMAIYLADPQLSVPMRFEFTSVFMRAQVSPVRTTFHKSLSLFLVPLNQVHLRVHSLGVEMAKN